MTSPKTILQRYGLSPRKSWGQNFLREPRIHQQIVTALGDPLPSTIVEIGAGLGTLTNYLLQTGAMVWAIERDRDLCHVLRQEFANEDRFQLCEADAVAFDYRKVFEKTKNRPVIVGNLPYHLSGPLLFRLLEAHVQTSTWIVMVQREVGDRLLAKPGSRTYGGITAAMSRERAFFRVCNVAPDCFLPPPKVQSIILRIEALAAPRGDVRDRNGYLHLVRVAFQQRRKTILNSLSTMFPKSVLRSWCELANIDPSSRPETIAPEQFAHLQRQREQYENESNSRSFR